MAFRINLLTSVTDYVSPGIATIADITPTNIPLVIQIEGSAPASSQILAMSKLALQIDAANSAAAKNSDYRIIQFWFMLANEAFGVNQWYSYALAQDWNQKAFNSEPDQNWLDV